MTTILNQSGKIKATVANINTPFPTVAVQDTIIWANGTKSEVKEITEIEGVQILVL